MGISAVSIVIWLTSLLIIFHKKLQVQVKPIPSAIVLFIGSAFQVIALIVLIAFLFLSELVVTFQMLHDAVLFLIVSICITIVFSIITAILVMKVTEVPTSSSRV
ncbi:unnamed protein product [Caenorhabditis bovis]|uniref:Uncharacterized protein n=1 Tax=Caenorhabditis bovis TaxID=2654633 RepID=A0A8S1EY74_9PELO|nr:unnamed protein product [Caenorhabditis bovis]